MTTKTLPMFGLLLAAQVSFSQSGMFAVTANEKGGTAWNKIRSLDNNRPTILLDAAAPALFIEVQSKKPVTPLMDGRVADNLPGQAGVAALAYDAANNRLYFAPMFREGGLRYINLNEHNAQPSVMVMETAYNLVDRAKDGEGKNITRMTIGRGGIGYAISNDGKSFLRFSTTTNGIVENLGTLVDAESNGGVSVHQQCTSWGGDIVAAATGDLYLFSTRQMVFKINPETRVATYLGQIKGPDANFSVNGAAVDEKGNVVLCSSVQAGVKWVMEDIHSLKATAVLETEWMNASDLASSNLLFAKSAKQPAPIVAVQPASPLVEVYPNPVWQGDLIFSCTDLPLGKYEVVLHNSSGSNAVSKSIQVATKGQVEKLNVRNLPKGWYVLRISGINHKKNFSQKVLIH